MIPTKNNSLKEYYVKLQGMYNNAVNLLTAINQSLSTSASEVSITVADMDSTESIVRIPSFLYLENKLEQLENNFSALFEMPQSGEAWFNNNSNMYKLELVKSNTAPLIPEFSNDKIFANTKYNNIFKDLVNPKTYLKLNISNLPNNIQYMYMKKFVFYDVNLYNLILSKNIESYNDCIDALYNYNKGIDYDEYDSEIKLPLKKKRFNSRFEIINIPELESGNPWTDVISSDSHNHLCYKVRLNTLSYTDSEDDSIQFSLKKGDYVTLNNANVIYKVKNTSYNISNTEDSNECFVILEEYIGHIALQTFEENQNMVLTIYDENYSEYNYVEIPLEENPYICIFVGNVYNNIRSLLSKPILLNLNNIYMKDSNNNYIYKDNSNTPYTYIEYYNKYCKNIGDLMLGFIETTYPQLSNYSNSQIYELENSNEIKELVSSTLSSNNVLEVQRINDHLTDDVTAENIINLHNEKSEINIQLSSLQSNINQIYNQLISTDFSQNNSINQDSLRNQLQDYYNQRNELQKQQITIIDNINVLKGNSKGLDTAKFRIRGVAEVATLEKYLHDNYGNKCDIICLEIEYKYKSINKNTTNVSVINSNTFTDWNRQTNIDKERKLTYDEYGNYIIKYDDYNLTNNIIKWNQINIPITEGEDVIIRVRYKYCVGQPFINIYTPWSDEITVSFPAELSETTELSNIISINNTDSIQAGFNSTLINEGYQEHITNKIIDNSQIFYHQPENIYSGFNTSENKLISLKDKLIDISNSINEYKTQIENELNSDYKVYLEFDKNKFEIYNTNETNISINSDNNIIQDKFIKYDMNLIITNTGSIDIKLYSIFPGNTNTPLLLSNYQFYNEYISNYERVPLLYGESNIPLENIYYQTLGQWIYFRQNNPYSKKEYYFNNKKNNEADLNTAISGGKNVTFSNNILDYLPKNYSQVLLGYRSRQDYIEISNSLETKWGKLEINNNSIIFNKAVNTNIVENSESLDSYYNNKEINFFIPLNNDEYSNNYLLCYEYLTGKYNNNVVYLSEDQPIAEFLSKCLNNEISAQNLTGAFLIPHLKTNADLLCNKMDKNQYITLNTGKSISIPIVFEYYFNSTNISSITKTLAFDIRTSILKDPEHYVINITANKNKTKVNLDLQMNSTMVDEVIDK